MPELHILSCLVKDGEIRPDPETLIHLQELPIPSNMKAHKQL